MKRWAIRCLVVAAATGAAWAAEETFSKTLPAADFSAAGLGKLSAEEIARLDGLVRDYKSGALERARREAAAAEARAAKAEAETAANAARAARSKTAAETPSMLKKAKVLLTPGTEIEYTTVESRLVGEFRGWDRRTTFTLENGQRWQATGADTYVAARPISNPIVKIVPGVLGSFWLTVEGVKQRVKVALVGSSN